MNLSDYRKGYECLAKLREVGKIIASMDCSLQEQNTLLAPVSDAVDTINVALAKGRKEAESEIFIEPTSFRGFIQNVINYFRNDQRTN